MGQRPCGGPGGGGGGRPPEEMFFFFHFLNLIVDVSKKGKSLICTF